MFGQPRWSRTFAVGVCPSDLGAVGYGHMALVEGDRMNDVELLEWMKTADARSLQDRLERLKFVRKQHPRENDHLFFGGLIPSQAFQEMQFCYIHGAYISCTLAAQVVLEHLFAALLEWNGREDLDGLGFKALSEEALAESLISQNEFDDFESLRRIRNPYTHSKPFMGESCIVRRSAESRLAPHELFKEDAEKALTIVIKVLSRQPFAFPSVGESRAEQ
jgi:hypothetical protein